MSGLQNKRILVTGGTTGIGFETAKLFQAEGARLIVTGANSDRLARAREDFGPDVTVLQADSADIAAQRRLAAEIGERFGQLDAAFLNAGISDWRPIEEWDEAGFDRSFAVNVKGPYFLIQALLPVFANPASVVLNTSINAHIGMVRSSVYAATKAAYLSLIKTLSSELLPRGIRFNAVSPGPVDTPLFDKLGIPDAYRAQVNEQIVGTIPAGRFGKPSEIAQAVAYLASDRSAWTVGAELILDGGRLLNA